MSLNGLLNSTITVNKQTGYNDYAEPTYGDSSTYNARIEFVPERVILDTGDYVRSSAHIFLTGNVPIEIEDKITYTTVGGISVTPKILAIETIPDNRGTNFITVVYL